MLPSQPTFLHGISFGVFITVFILLLLQFFGTGVVIFQNFGPKDGVLGALALALMWTFVSMIVSGPACALWNRTRDLLCFLAIFFAKVASMAWKRFVAPAVLPDFFAALDGLRKTIRFFSFR